MKPPGEPVKAQITAQTPRVAGLLVLGWRRICISSKFPGDTDAAGWGPHFEKHWVKGIGFFHSLKDKLFIRTLKSSLISLRNENEKKVEDRT